MIELKFTGASMAEVLAQVAKAAGVQSPALSTTAVKLEQSGQRPDAAMTPAPETPVRRHRRTNAEIAADKAAAGDGIAARPPRADVIVQPSGVRTVVLPAGGGNPPMGAASTVAPQPIDPPDTDFLGTQPAASPAPVAAVKPAATPVAAGDPAFVVRMQGIITGMAERPDGGGGIKDIVALLAGFGKKRIKELTVDQGPAVEAACAAIVAGASVQDALAVHA